VCNFYILFKIPENYTKITEVEPGSKFSGAVWL
ncbi:unnamed protein product, partial [marine sediment metagenome]